MPALIHYRAFGESKTAPQWAKDSRCMVGLTTLSGRLRKGWDTEKAILQPIGQFGPKPKHENVRCDIGPLKAGGKGRHRVVPRIELDVPTRITNSSMRELYVPPFMGRL